MSPIVYRMLTRALVTIGRVRDNETAMLTLRADEQAMVRKSYNELADYLFGVYEPKMKRP